MSDYTLTLITTSFPIRGDGSEAAGAFVADLVEELAKHICVHVVAPGLKTEQENWSGNVQVFRYASPSQPLSTLKPWRPSDLRAITQVLHGGMQASRRAAQGSQHILALWALPSGEWARRAAKKLNIPYSVWMLGSDVWSFGKIPIVRSVLASVIQQALHAYADGYLLADDAKKISGRNIAFLPSTRKIGLQVYKSPREQAPYRFLFLGRWHPNKGIDLLLEALELLGEDDWVQIEVVEIQGGGSMQALVEKRIKALQEQGRSVVLGSYLDKDEAEAAIARADWLLIPSRIESIPVVFSDAMKMGRPVISMPTGDLPRLLNDEACGVLASSISSDAYMIAIQQALKSPVAPFRQGVQRQAVLFNLQRLAEDLVEKILHHG